MLSHTFVGIFVIIIVVFVHLLKYLCPPVCNFPTLKLLLFACIVLFASFRDMFCLNLCSGKVKCSTYNHLTKSLWKQKRKVLLSWFCPIMNDVDKNIRVLAVGILVYKLVTEFSCSASPAVRFLRMQFTSSLHSLRAFYKLDPNFSAVVSTFSSLIPVINS